MDLVVGLLTLLVTGYAIWLARRDSERDKRREREEGKR
jgi:hypothetical protein